ncbi:TetR/AcrR family transcriptional regulator C-terminal ligand-binding domain-containing protein [Actinoplanes sp. NPDC051851]|uniref:TetR/AcrR family transcriptional regulator n=1 Tax=Actinoplanes sp. NPDC051851 TaxID=3154753 RepID=UPI00341749EC
MTQVTGNARPGGRTARTRDAVHAAVRELLATSADGTISLPEVAARSGVHQATIYRRWRTAEALLLDVAMADVNDRSPVPATGDLRADLLAYGRHLAVSVTRPGGLGLLRALISAAADPAVGLAGAGELTEQRMERFQTMLDRAGATELTPVDILELIHFPLYVAAMMLHGQRPPDVPEMPGNVERLVDNVIAVLEHRRG